MSKSDTVFTFAIIAMFSIVTGLFFVGIVMLGQHPWQEWLALMMAQVLGAMELAYIQQALDR